MGKKTGPEWDERTYHSVSGWGNNCGFHTLSYYLVEIILRQPQRLQEAFADKDFMRSSAWKRYLSFLSRELKLSKIPSSLFELQDCIARAGGEEAFLLVSGRALRKTFADAYDEVYQTPDHPLHEMVIEQQNAIADKLEFIMGLIITDSLERSFLSLEEGSTFEDFIVSLQGALQAATRHAPRDEHIVPGQLQSLLKKFAKSLKADAMRAGLRPALETLYEMRTSKGAASAALSDAASVLTMLERFWRPVSEKAIQEAPETRIVEENDLNFFSALSFLAAAFVDAREQWPAQAKAFLAQNRQLSLLQKYPWLEESLPKILTLSAHVIVGDETASDSDASEQSHSGPSSLASAAHVAAGPVLRPRVLPMHETFVDEIVEDIQRKHYEDDAEGHSAVFRMLERFMQSASSEGLDSARFPGFSSFQAFKRAIEPEMALCALAASEAYVLPNKIDVAIAKDAWKEIQLGPYLQNVKDQRKQVMMDVSELHFLANLFGFDAETLSKGVAWKDFSKTPYRHDDQAYLGTFASQLRGDIAHFEPVRIHSVKQSNPRYRVIAKAPIIDERAAYTLIENMLQAVYAVFSFLVWGMWVELARCFMLYDSAYDGQRAQAYDQQKRTLQHPQLKEEDFAWHFETAAYLPSIGQTDALPQVSAAAKAKV